MCAPPLLFAAAGRRRRGAAVDGRGRARHVAKGGSARFLPRRWRDAPPRDSERRDPVRSLRSRKDRHPKLQGAAVNTATIPFFRGVITLTRPSLIAVFRHFSRFAN